MLRVAVAFEAPGLPPVAEKPEHQSLLGQLYLDGAICPPRRWPRHVDGVQSPAPRQRCERWSRRPKRLVREVCHARRGKRHGRSRGRAARLCSHSGWLRVIPRYLIEIRAPRKGEVGYRIFVVRGEEP